MIFIEIISCLLCGILDALGGWRFIWMRRFIMPSVIGVTVSLVTHVWWCGLLTLPVMGTLCLGYFSGQNWGRGLWLFTQAVVISIGLTITGHMAWYYFLGYTVIAGFLGGIYKNWQQNVGDFVTGCWLGTVVLFVR